MKSSSISERTCSRALIKACSPVAGANLIPQGSSQPAWLLTQLQSSWLRPCISSCLLGRHCQTFPAQWELFKSSLGESCSASSGQGRRDHLSFLPPMHRSIGVMGHISIVSSTQTSPNASPSTSSQVNAPGCCRSPGSRSHFPLIIPHNHSYPITHSPPCHEAIPAHSC